ncbi:MAG TPA: YbaB/EbfC family nucleoid-associated protein [bacterium]|nr:MAG: Nucleoid-associated protein [bacterium ADurb.Bin236]HOY63787.1 YbaB/EbfC family nucleoid-associated protein [bacterium]HPI76528.1 YbaB/EbfC family nucleoid-associated protein [bacterium]HPN94236.1 YbaB/EbfC family nucleoid-associated protein [bacterium]
MSFDMGNIGGLLEKMQEDMARIQAELDEARITGSAPGGKVTCKVNGTRDILEVKIDPSAIDPSDVEMLEDLVLFAVRDAMKKAEEFSQSKMGAMANMLPKIPGLQFPPM